MERDLFDARFRQAARRTRDFAKPFLEEELPDAMVFRVHLNSSYDASASADVRLFPEDSSPEKALATKGLDADQVVSLLFRDGCVPQWVDLSVVDETGDFTVIELLVCGRFLDDETRLYYTWTDIAPFSPKGPTLPVGYVEGQRFSVHERASCWTVDDLERARRHAEKIRFLSLHGPAFDDGALADLGDLPVARVLELDGVYSSGSGLRGLSRVAALAHLRARFAGRDRMDLTSFPALAHLESLTLTSLPPSLSGVTDLGRRLIALRRLTLGSALSIEPDGVLTVPTLEELTLELPDVPRWVHIPSTLRGLSLHAPRAADDDVEALLGQCPVELASVSLRGSPVSTRVLRSLERFHSLKYVDAVGSRISADELHAFAQSRPGLRSFPKPRSTGA